MRLRSLLAAAGAVLLAGCDELWPRRDTAGWTGYVEAATIHATLPESGRILSIAPRAGDRIAAGDFLFALDAAGQEAAVTEAVARLVQAEAELADLRAGARAEEIAVFDAQIAEAEALLRLAEVELVRQERLSTANVAARQALEQARAEQRAAEARVAQLRAQRATAVLAARPDAVAAAEAQVEVQRAALAQAEWRLDQFRVAAPVDALVLDVLRAPGEWAPAGAPVLELLPPDGIRIRFFVPEPARHSVRPGAVLRLSCDGCPDGLSASVAWLSPTAEYTPPVIYGGETRARLVYMAEAIPAPGVDLHPGQPVDVRLAEPAR